MSVPYSASEIWHTNYGDATFVVYMILVAIEIIIHVYLKHYKLIAIDAAQILFSLVFTRVLNIFKALIPEYSTDLSGTVWGTMPVRLAFLLLGIILTGVGAAMMLNARSDRNLQQVGFTGIRSFTIFLRCNAVFPEEKTVKITLLSKTAGVGDFRNSCVCGTKQIRTDQKSIEI